MYIYTSYTFNIHAHTHTYTHTLPLNPIHPRFPQSHISNTTNHFKKEREREKKI